MWGIYAFPISHIDAFAFGAYISQFSLPKAKQQFYALTLAVPLVGFVAQFAATGSFGMWQDFGYPFSLPRAYQFIWGYSILNYWFAVTIYAVARDGLFNRFLEMKALKYLGKISYGMYVYHVAIIWFAGRIRDVLTVEEPVAKFLTAVIGFIVSLVVASLSYFLLEKPLLNLKERYFSLKPLSADGAVPVEKALPG